MNKHESRDRTNNQRFTFLQLDINNRKCCNTRNKFFFFLIGIVTLGVNRIKKKRKRRRSEQCSAMDM